MIKTLIYKCIWSLFSMTLICAFVLTTPFTAWNRVIYDKIAYSLISGVFGSYNYLKSIT